MAIHTPFETFPPSYDLFIISLRELATIVHTLIPSFTTQIVSCHSVVI